MLENVTIKPDKIIGPKGSPMTAKDLPSPNTSRWVARRKAEVVAAVNGGLLTIREACDRYELSLEEFASWQRAVDREGVSGLRATRMQHHRNLQAREEATSQ